MFSIMKTRERERARQLRRDEGASIKEIARRVGVSVSSVSTWVRDIELTAEQQWAEGAKHRNTLRFTNSDPEMVRLFVRFVRKYFEIDDDAIRVTCNLFADHIERQREIERFWLEVANLPETCLCKSSVNVYSKYSQKKRRNKLPYGTCRVSVSRTAIVEAIYGAIQAIGGFTREAWLE